ncbi:hypothetical protein T484DRAFT_1634540 [Baffinella frigidus]|nr:hypothetical protein T484DRAFT_1634540 [Cryptophyta sp. CCMP2293]
MEGWREREAATISIPPHTQRPHPSTLHAQPPTLSTPHPNRTPPPSTLHPDPSTLDPPPFHFYNVLTSPQLQPDNFLRFRALWLPQPYVLFPNAPPTPPQIHPRCCRAIS